ncbi:hypothetical protein ZEAMMB73_Zm00001d028198 [Zea mays]|uniref:Glycosyl transferase 48 domain-containing protein n=1 Tax=Zea mays TaxID=4577 RepID=A0A1D6JST4_MAIZE|nr:hypothetical protein ZEAMMB73_Zm00001d028198 [Zea mays]
MTASKISIYTGTLIPDCVPEKVAYLTERAGTLGSGPLRVASEWGRVRFHYGHPDVFDRIFHITRGGISKASCGINLSEDILAAQARTTALESREVIAVEALKQAKDEHVQKLMEAYLVTHNQRRALRIQEPAPSNPVQPMRAEDPQILEGHPVSTRGEKKAWELLEGAIVLEGIPVSLQDMDKQEHPESSQDPPPELFEPFTMKKIPAPSREIKEEAASTPPAPPPSEELQEPVQLEEEFNLVLPSQSPPEEVINISSLLTHPGNVSD